jgi:hypothetical protein
MRHATLSDTDETLYSSFVLLSRIMGVDWQLNGCCNTEEIIFLVLLVVYFVINFLLWNTFLVKPMKVRVLCIGLSKTTMPLLLSPVLCVLSIADCRLCP